MAELTISPGDVPTAAQMNSYWSHTGSAWNTWAPAVIQSGAVSFTTVQASYFRAGRLIIATCALSLTSTGTANNVITVSLPATATNGTANTFIGVGKVYDASGPTEYYSSVVLNSTTTCKFHSQSSTASTFLGETGAVFAAALASSDVIDFVIMYEAATG